MGKILGSAVEWAIKAVFDPILQSFLKVIFWAPFQFLLEIFNFIEYSFLWLTGVGGDKIIFNSTIQQDGFDNNFFKNPSPIQQAYLIFFSISGSLFVLFVSLAAFRTMVKSKGGKSTALNAMYTGSGALLSSAFIPTAVMTLLGFVGGLTTIFTGGEKLPPSSGEMIAAKSYLIPLIDSFVALGDESKNTLEANENYVTDNVVYPYLEVKFDLDNNGYVNESYDKWIDMGNAPEVEFTTITKAEFEKLGTNKLWKDDLDTTIVVHPTFVSAWKDSVVYSQINGNMQPSEFNLPFGSGEVSKYSALISTYDIIKRNVGTDDADAGYINDSLSSDTNNLTNSLDEEFAASSSGLVKLENGKLLLNEEFSETSIEIKKGIESLTTGYNEDVSALLYDYQNELLTGTYAAADFLGLIKNWNNKWTKALSNDAIETEMKYSFKWNSTSQDFIAIANQLVIANHLNNIDVLTGEIFSNVVYGSSINNKNIKTIKDIQTHTSHLVYGANEKFYNGSSINISTLANKTTEFNPSSTTVMLYRVASGNNDSSWRSTPKLMKFENLLIGFVLIIMGGYVYVQLIPKAIYRILAIGVLFITSPIWAVWATMDGGKKFFKWFDVFFSQAMGMLILIVAFRVYEIMISQITLLIDTSSEEIFQNSLMKNIFIGVVSVVSLMSIPKMTTLVSGVLGIESQVADLDSGSGGLKKAAMAATGGAAALVAKGASATKGAAGSVGKKAAGGVNNTRKNMGIGSAETIGKHKEAKLQKQEAKVEKMQKKKGNMKASGRTKPVAKLDKKIVKQTKKQDKFKEKIQEMRAKFSSDSDSK